MVSFSIDTVGSSGTTTKIKLFNMAYWKTFHIHTTITITTTAAVAATATTTKTTMNMKKET